MSNTKYFTFPVLLLKDALEDLPGTLDNIIKYGMYQYAAASSRETDLSIEECFKDSYTYFELTPKNIPSVFKAASNLFDSLPDGLPISSVSDNVIFDYVLNKQKTEFEIMCLCGFAATKSILGRKQYAKITNQYFLARMFGFAKVEDMKSSTHGPMIQKYAKRYYLDKVKDELKASWGIKLYGRKTRGFYASISMNYESLVFEVEKNRKSRIRQERKAAEEEVQKRVLARLTGK